MDIKKRCITAALLVMAIPSLAQARVLRVGVSGSPPFVEKNGELYEGISVEVWRQIAAARELDYRFILQPNTDLNVKAVANGRLDLAIGPISITPDRMANSEIVFTQPYFFAEQGLLLPTEPPQLWMRIKPLFGLAALSSLAFLLISIFIVGNLIWLVERRHNPDHFPRQYLKGVANGTWFALVTLTTVGYGDRAPLTQAGRAIAGAWMVISLVTVSTITAGLASAFTISLSKSQSSGITKPAHLDGKLMAVVSGTSSEFLARRYGARSLPAPTLGDAANLVKQGDASGMIFDTPALNYYLKHNPDKTLSIAPFPLSLTTYGFVLPKNSKLTRMIDIELLRLFASGRMETIENGILK
jgi:polar amino acid transport system substrate-binding protein